VQFDDANRRDEGDLSVGTARESVDALLSGGVDVIIGPATSEVAGKVVHKVVCAGVVMFSPATTAAVLSTAKYDNHGRYFRTSPSDVFRKSVLGSLVVADKNSTVAVMSRDDLFGNGLREATVKAIRDAGGQVVASFSYDPRASNYDRQIQRIKALDPDAIILMGFTESGPILAKMIEQGPDPKNKNIYGVGNMSRTLVGQVNPRNPDALVGMKGVLVGAENEEFLKRFRAANPGLQDSMYAARAYDAVVTTTLAAAVTGTDAPAAIARQINGVTKDGITCTSFADCMKLVLEGQDIDYNGASGPLEFTDAGEPSSATYLISEFQADGSLKALRTEEIGL
jgi:branched-chain amino acid transport system substrate-binding protein